MGSHAQRLCLGAALLFGLTTPVAALLVDDLGPLRMAGLLYLGAAVAVAPSCVRQPPTRHGVRVARWPLVGAVIFGGVIGPALLTTALQHVAVASASLLLNLELPFTVILAWLLFREHIHRNVAVGALIITAAGVILVWAPGSEFVAAALLVVGATACWALDNCLTANIDAIRPTHVVMAKGVVAGITNVALSVPFDSAPLPSPWVVLAVMLLGACGYGVSILWWVDGARELGAARAQALFATAPFFGAALGAATDASLPEAATIVAFVMAGVGVMLATRGAHDHDHAHAPLEHDHAHQHDDGHHHHVHDGLALNHRHSHPHSHDADSHQHSHVSDLHHRHEHH